MVSTPSGPDPIGPAPSGPEPAAPAAQKRHRVIAAVLSLLLVAVVAVSALLFSRPAAEVAAPAPTITDTATPTP